MRAPDHADAAADAGADAGAGEGEADAAAPGVDADEVTLLGGAKTAEQKAAEAGKGAEGGDAADGADASQEADAAGPPESYELAAPEGLEITPEIAAEVTPIFQELGLSNEGANKLMPLAKSFADRIMTAQADEFAATKADWAKQAKADPELGGTNYEETEHLVAKALDLAGAPEGSPFRTLLNESGLGNHPEMLRIFRFFGKSISEEPNFIRGDGAAAVKQSPEEILYPSMAKKD
jgi:hypothetical protein